MFIYFLSASKFESETEFLANLASLPTTVSPRGGLLRDRRWAALVHERLHPQAPKDSAADPPAELNRTDKAAAEIQDAVTRQLTRMRKENNKDIAAADIQDNVAHILAQACNGC